MKKLSTILISVAFATILNLSTWQVDKSFAAEISQGFTGQEQHSDSLLDYNARYYDADLARFPQADRVDVFEMTGNPQDINAYAYVKNNPVNRVDPSGNTDVPTFDQLSGFDTSYQSYSVNTNIICCDTTGMEYIDGNWIDTTQEFSMDYYEQDLAGEYESSLLGRLGVSPGLGVPLKGVWDEILRTVSLTSRMMGGESLSTADKFDVAMAPVGGMGTAGKSLVLRQLKIANPNIDYAKNLSEAVYGDSIILGLNNLERLNILKLLATNSIPGKYVGKFGYLDFLLPATPKIHFFVNGMVNSRQYYNSFTSQELRWVMKTKSLLDKTTFYDDINIIDSHDIAFRFSKLLEPISKPSQY